MRNKRIRVGGRPLARVVGVLVLAFMSLVAGSHAASAVIPSCTGIDCYPATQDDEYTTVFNTQLTVAAPGVLANDEGADGTHVYVDDSDSDSWNGATITLRANGSFTYTPDPANPFSGVDQFDYAIIDRHDNEEYGTVYVQVDPIVTDDSSYTHVNQILTVPTPGVYANDLGLDDAFAPDYDDTSIAGGSVTVNDDGSFQYMPPAGFAGVDSFTYSQWDIDYDNEYTGKVLVYVDSTGPTVSMATLPAASLATKMHVGWSGADAISGVAGYDVNQTAAAWNGDYGAATAVGRALTSTAVDRVGTYGRTYCYTARAHDNAGNISAWTARRCTSVPLKSTQLTYSAGWTPLSNSAYFAGSATKTTTFGAKATRTSIKAKQIWLIVSKCSTCGVVTVRWNGVVKANVNLYSATPQHKVVVSVLALSAPQSGMVTATLASHGKMAIIEGLAVYRG